MMAGVCIISKESLLQTSDIQTVGDRGNSSLISASIVRQDSLHRDLHEAQKPYKVHRCCFKDYFRKYSLESLKRKPESAKVAEEDSTPSIQN